MAGSTTTGKAKWTVVPEKTLAGPVSRAAMRNATVVKGMMEGGKEYAEEVAQEATSKAISRTAAKKGAFHEAVTQGIKALSPAGNAASTLIKKWRK